MSELFREVLADATSLSQLADKVTHPPVRLAILEAARKTLEHAIDLLPTEVHRKYILPKNVEFELGLAPAPGPAAAAAPGATSREKFTPWSLKKVDHNSFKRDILSFLRGAYKERKPTENMKEMHKLWEMFKHLPTVEESIRCAIEEVKAATRDA